MARLIYTLACLIYTLARLIYTLARLIYTLARLIYTLARLIYTLARLFCTYLTGSRSSPKSMLSLTVVFMIQACCVTYASEPCTATFPFMRIICNTNMISFWTVDSHIGSLLSYGNQKTGIEGFEQLCINKHIHPSNSIKSTFVQIWSSYNFAATRI